MKSYSRIQQFCAFALILIFTVQAGLGLWLHRALHQHPAKSLVYSKNNLPVVQQGISFSTACSCTDNFLVPFVGATNVEFTFQALVFFTAKSTRNYCNVSCELQVFRPLRGPPIMAV